jgi:murein L,D-transpeptidase YafK
MENNSLEQLIQLKFSLEKEINVLQENYEKLEFRKQLSNNTDKMIITQYDTNIKMFGKDYLREQKQLLNEINKILSETCDHHWIEDEIDEPLSTRYICYCSKCYLYKKNIKIPEY